ncbi:MAG: endolytic transglycosylase MltG [Bdellovibrionota bacterium]
MKKIIFFLLLVVTLGLGYFYYEFVSEPNPTLTQEIIVDVAPKTSFKGILNSLKEQKVDIPEIPAKIAARIFELDKKIHIGEYRITPPLSSLEILKKITNGKSILRNLLIKEGYNRWDIQNTWQALPYFNSLEFNKLVVDPELIEKAKIPSEASILTASNLNMTNAKNFRSLEGYMFPETYSIQKYDSMRSVIAEMLLQFDGRARDILNKHPWSQSDLGFYRLLTLASIVEKESGNGEEQPLVASVFWNRLNKKMRLQSDPTTIYGLMPNFDGNLKRIHLTTFGIFNTYKIPELPVGPICNPGEKALRAVLSPAATPYLYFVSRGDGSHIFAESYKDHDKNVKKFQLKQ